MSTSQSFYETIHAPCFWQCSGTHSDGARVLCVVPGQRKTLSGLSANSMYFQNTKPRQNENIQKQDQNGLFLRTLGAKTGPKSKVKRPKFGLETVDQWESSSERPKFGPRNHSVGGVFKTQLLNRCRWKFWSCSGLEVLSRILDSQTPSCVLRESPRK